MALHGYTKLELLRDGKVIKRVEKRNTITPFVPRAITNGDFHAMMDRTKILPIAQNWFGGCILTNSANPTTGDAFGLIAGDTDVIAMAGNDAYTGTNHRRGSADFSTGKTGEIENGYRFVWNWAENYGNGHIESVCLTRPALGKVHFLESGNFDYEDDQTLPVTYANEQLSAAPLSMTDNLLGVNIIDYEREIGYAIDYEGDDTAGNIIVKEYALNTKQLHITGASLDVRHQIGTTHVIAVSGGVKNFNYFTAFVMYVGNLIHLITFKNSSGNGIVNDYVIDPSDYSALNTIYSRTYTGVEFVDFAGSSGSLNNTTLVKDGMWIEYENGTPYMYALASVDSSLKIIKCNLTSDADVSEFADDPLATDFNGSWIGLPNGDRYKTMRIRENSNALYWHNGKWYKTNIDKHLIQGSYLQGIHSGDTYGINLFKAKNVYSQAEYKTLSLDALFPWVSTVNNLAQADFVDKNITMTMTLTYEITETNS